MAIRTNRRDAAQSVGSDGNPPEQQTFGRRFGMAAEAARVLDYEYTYNYGAAAPAIETFPESAPAPQEIPSVDERIRQRERAREAAAFRSLPGLSLFSVAGALFAAVLAVFMILAQINYNEAVAETARLNTQLNELSDQQRRLEITFESVLDMKEIERYARDVLGMSKPESYQLAVVHSATGDRAEVLSGSEVNNLRGFGSFLSSLLEYFKR